jgi:hypothetical protein
MNLHRNPNEGFVELTMRVAHERHISLREAMRVVSSSFPDLAERYSTDEI